LKLVNENFANATFEEARQFFEETKEEHPDIPASVTFEYALLNNLLTPESSRQKRSTSDNDNNNNNNGQLKISSTPFIVIAVASALGLFSSIVLCCHKICSN